MHPEKKKGPLIHFNFCFKCAFSCICATICEICVIQFYLSALLTHHNTIGHEEHHPAKDMNHKEGYWHPTQAIILTAAKDIPMTCNRAKSHK